MEVQNDILQEIPDEDLPKLKNVYKNVSYASYVYSFINTLIKWKTKYPDEKFVTFYAPALYWKSHGTFIAHMMPTYDFLVFTTEKSCDKLYNSFTKTTRFEYRKPWPPRYEDSDKLLHTLLKVGSGYGIFLKENDDIVSWVFKNQMGMIGILGTSKDYRKKGYGSILTKYLSKEIAQEGHNPDCTIVKGNIAFQKLFEGFGFEILDQVTYVACKKV